MALVRAATEADNSALVVVRASLALTNYSNNPFSVVAAAARASKYSSRSSANMGVPLAFWAGVGDLGCQQPDY